MFHSREQSWGCRVGERADGLLHFTHKTTPTCPTEGLQGLGSALHCHHTARAGRSIGTGGWEAEVFKHDSRSAEVLPSWPSGVVFLLAQFSAHRSNCLTLKATASSVRNNLQWSIRTSALPRFPSVLFPHSPNHGVFTAKVTTPLSAHPPGTLASTQPHHWLLPGPALAGASERDQP